MEFLDTNVLVYAASGAPADAKKASVARALCAQPAMAISLQILQEFYVAARHPKKLAFSHAEALAYCTAWRRFQVLEPTLGIFDEALALVVRFQLSFFDAFVVAAARASGCRVLHSEDLSDGQDLGGVRVSNPFRGI